MRARMDLIFAVAHSHAYTNLVLGAWGCGVFQNDPRAVARLFQEHLTGPRWDGIFERVCFAVYDRSKTQAVRAAFEETFAP